MHTALVIMKRVDCMSQQLGSEVERQRNANQLTTPRTAISFQRKEEEPPLVGFEQSRRAWGKKALRCPYIQGFLEGMYICVYM